MAKKKRTRIVPMDVVEGIGLAMLIGGVYLAFGLPVALMSLGGLTFAVCMYARLRRPRPRRSPSAVQ